MRVFITVRRVLVLFLMLLSLPGALPASVSAQEWTPCDDAVGITPDIGEYSGDYEVVSSSGGSGSQLILGTDGPDSLSGGSGNDILCGYGGIDTLEGGSGDDILVGGDGDDNLYGGSGNDTFYATGTDWVDEGSGQDEIVPVTDVNPNCAVAWDHDHSLRAQLEGIDLSGCDLSQIFYDEANLSGAIFNGTFLNNSILRLSNLSGASLIGAHLNGANLIAVNLTGADLTNADLTGADLTGHPTIDDVIWDNTICPDGHNSSEYGGTCEGHLNT